MAVGSGSGDPVQFLDPFPGDKDDWVDKHAINVIGLVSKPEHFI